MKGVVESVEPASPADRIRFDRYCAEASRAIAESDGTPVELVQRMVPASVYACIVRVASIFDQTPGRSAGVQLAPEPS